MARSTESLGWALAVGIEDGLVRTCARFAEESASAFRPAVPVVA